MGADPAQDARAPADPRRRFLSLSGWLDEAWYRAHAVDLAPGDDLLSHYLEHGAPAGLAPNAYVDALQSGSLVNDRYRATTTIPTSDDRQLALEMELVASSGYFDEDFYARQVAAAGIEVSRRRLLRHFCRLGWREALRPSARFEVWWYWTNFLDPAIDDLNPLVHYLVIGRAAGFSALPSHHTGRPAGGGPLPQSPRRVCLFAGYDAHGVVDDYVVDYVRELARFADVYYLSDGYLAPEQLDKLAPYTRGAWAFRHACYDFGSWSILAEELVGWDAIEGYDELLLVNDSCYLLRPLDEVFTRMQARDCDWWGLQATKFLAATAHSPSNVDRQPIPIDEVREHWLPTYDQDEIYDFLIGSYFLAFRRPVIHDAHFRRLLGSVHRQRTKLTIIVKYEVGLTRFLNGNGYRFDTFVETLYPSQPVFTEWYFELLENGFPLLKKFLLYRNTYDVPDLVGWKQRVLEHAPDAPVEMLERNLLRTAPADELERSFAIVVGDDGAPIVPRRFTEDEFSTLDETTPTHDDWWAFVVSTDDHALPDNSRAIFEQVRHDPSITKVVLTRGRRVELDGPGVTVLALDSPAGVDALVRCRFVFIDQRPRLTLNLKPLSRAHHVVGVRGGLTILRVGDAARARPAERRQGRSPLAAALLTSSDLDQLSMLAVHRMADYSRCRRTGIPASDFVLADEAALPPDFRAAEQRLRAQLAGRRLLLFVPEWVGTGRPHYAFGATELAWLREWSERHQVVLGLRDSPRDHGYQRLLEGVATHLSPFEYPHLPVLLRVADALLTDFSGSALDFLVTGRPVVSFIHDLEQVRAKLFYEPEQVLPGPVCRTFDELADELDRIFEPPDAVARHRYERSRQLFHDHLDGRSTARAMAVLRELSALDVEAPR